MSPDPSGTAPAEPVGPMPMHTLLERTERVAVALGRADLARGTRSAADRLSDTVADLFVIGEYQKGKSAVFNALLEGSLSASGPALSTTSPIRAVYDADPGIFQAIAQPGPDGRPDPTTASWEEVSPIDLDRFLTGASSLPDGTVRMVIDAYLDHAWLAEGFSLVDSPPLARGVSLRLHDVIAGADGVLFVTDASQELTASEMRFLTVADEMDTTVIVAVNKIDMYPEWERIVDLDRNHLRAAGLEIEVVPISASLHQQGVARGRAELIEVAGIRRLRAMWDSSVRLRLGAHSHANAATTVASTLDQLRAPVQAEIAAITGAPPVEEPDAPEPGLRWDVGLTACLAEERDRFTKELDALIQRLDEEAMRTLRSEEPDAVWQELSQWLDARTAEDVAGLVGRLPGHLSDAATRLAERLRVAAPPDPSEAERLALDVEQPTDIDTGKPSRSTSRQAIVGGALMGSSGVSTVLSLLGLSIAGSIAIAALPVAGGVAFAADRYRESRRSKRGHLEKVYGAEVTKYLRSVDKEARASANRSLLAAKEGYTAHFRTQVAQRDRTIAESAEARAPQSATDERTREARLEELRKADAAIDALERELREISEPA